MSYLTFDEYEEMGGALDETAFDRLAFAADREIDAETFGRLIGVTTVPEAVKQLVYALVQLDVASDMTQAPVASETVGSWSKSYKDRTADEYAEERQRLIRTYLFGLEDANGVPLLYRGC